MLNFKKIELSDREWVNEQLAKSDFRGCEYSFASNYIWSKPFNMSFANVNGFYCLKSESKGSVFYTYPAGSGDIKSTIESLVDDAKQQGHKFILRGITEDNLENMKEMFKDIFVYNSDRDESDYIYLVEKLTSLSGKKFHSKRNHIARFKDNENWAYENITKDNIDECYKMNIKWCEKNSCCKNESLKDELCAVNKAFNNFFELNLTGGLLRLKGEVIAYTIGEPINSDTYGIHIEKAFGDIQGAYPMINQQFVIHNCQDYMYVNREEDVGDLGLRKAKLSYRPEIILDKYTATLKDE